LAYADAFAKLEARDPGALAAFTALVGASPVDALAQYHLRRMLNGGTGTRIEMA
jgi:adenylate cyclase